MEFLLKSSICMTAFYGLYYFIFSKFTFHTLNRYYLLISMALSTVIPLLTFEKEIIKYYEAQPVIEILPLVETFENTSLQKLETNIQQPETMSVSLIQILLVAYIIGAIAFASIFLKNILKIGLLISKLPFERIGSLKIHDGTNQFTNASFFNHLFIDSSNLNPHEKTLVIKHEELHFQKLHTIDLIIIGLYKAFFWFNPIAYFIQNSLKEIHEFEVDEAIAKTHNPKEYANLLLKLCVSNKFELVHQIGKLPLSERINFLFTKPTTKMKKSLYSICIPVVAIGIMAFAKQETVTVFKDKNHATLVTKIAVKTYPLTLKTDRNYATWGFTKSLQMSPTNITLNHLTTVNYNGFHYEVNPNSLTESTIKRANEEFKKRNLELVITEKETDFEGNLTKLGLAIKHLKTKEMTKSEVFDMKNYRDEGKNGAFFIIEAYDRNFKNSQIFVIFGSKDLLINKSNLSKSNHNTFNINSESSIISHSSDMISYTVFPDKLTLKAVEEANAYFSENGFTFELKDYTTNSAGVLEKANVLFGNQSRNFDLKEMRHWVKLKSEANSKPQRMDESLVFEGNLKTKETKILVNNFWFKSMEKSGKYEILDKNKLTTISYDTVPKDTIRTIPATNKLGKNPLVIINGVEYPAEILNNIDPEKIKGYSYYPPNNTLAIKKFGEKARDGVFETESRSADFIVTDKEQLERIKQNVSTELNAPKKRVVRILQKNEKGESYEEVIINRPDNQTRHMSINVPLKNRIVFIVDDKVVTEEYLQNCQLLFVSTACGESFYSFDFQKYGEIYRGYDGYFILFTKKQ